MLLLGIATSYAIVRGIDGARKEVAEQTSPSEPSATPVEQPPVTPPAETPDFAPPPSPPEKPELLPPTNVDVSPPLSPRAGTLTVTSVPRSSVSIDGNLIGVTPLTLETGVGSHEVALTAEDGLRWRARVEVAAGQVVSLHRDLNASGSLSIVSDLWADVRLDDRLPEQTPIHFSRVAAGLHSVRVSREGYVTQDLEVVIEEGKATSLRVTLEKTP